MTKAYLNALHEEGTRQDLMDWVVKLDDEVDTLRDQLARARKALEWYAKDYDHDRGYSMWDGGAAARLALSEMPK
jgi:hypothetical protein